MTQEQLLNFCKSQNWSAKIERNSTPKDDFWRSKYDHYIILHNIGIHHYVATIPFEINKSTKEVIIDSMTFNGGITDDEFSGKTYDADARLQADIAICDFIKNSVEKHKKYLSQEAKSTITKLQNKIERLKLFI